MEKEYMCCECGRRFQAQYRVEMDQYIKWLCPSCTMKAEINLAVGYTNNLWMRCTNACQEEFAL